MNVTKLVVLGALEQLGGGSAYDIVQHLASKMIQKWVDVKTGSVYYTIKQLLEDGSIREVSRTQEGNYPPKVIYAITDAGRQVFDSLQEQAFKGLYPDFFGFKLALKFNSRRSSAEIATFAQQAVAIIERVLAEMDAYLSTLDPHSEQYAYDAFFIDHDRRLFRAEQAWIEEAAVFMHQHEQP